MTEVFIFYARVSTHSVDQLESLKNQIVTLNAYMKEKKHTCATLVKEIKSISNNMSTTLKEIINSESEKMSNINIVVTNFDRLIRNFEDVSYLKANVSNIIAISEKKIINLKNNWKELIPYVISSVEEIDKLKLRLNQYNNLKKRKRSPDELILNSKQRACNLGNIVASSKYCEIVEDISNMIQKSQDLVTKDDWNYVATIAKEYGESTILKDYKKAIENQQEFRYRLSRKDILGYVENIFKYLHIKVDDFILKDFVNANITLGKNIIEYGDFNENTHETIDNHIENANDITEILKKISLANLDGILNQSEIEKMKSLLDNIKENNSDVVPKKKPKKLNC